MKASKKSRDTNDFFLTIPKIATLTGLKCPYKLKVEMMHQLAIQEYIKLDYIEGGKEYCSYRILKKGEEAFIDLIYKNNSDKQRERIISNAQKITIVIIMLLGLVINFFTCNNP